MQEESFALEILRELKHSAKRWFIISIIELILLAGSNIAWLLYESQYEEVTTEEQLIEDIYNSNNSSYTQTIN